MKLRRESRASKSDHPPLRDRFGQSAPAANIRISGQRCAKATAKKRRNSGQREAAVGHDTLRQQSRREADSPTALPSSPNALPRPQSLTRHRQGLSSFGFTKARLGKVTLVKRLFCDCRDFRGKKIRCAHPRNRHRRAFARRCLSRQSRRR